MYKTLDKIELLTIVKSLRKLEADFPNLIKNVNITKRKGKKTQQQQQILNLTSYFW